VLENSKFFWRRLRPGSHLCNCLPAVWAAGICKRYFILRNRGGSYAAKALIEVVLVERLCAVSAVLQRAGYAPFSAQK